MQEESPIWFNVPEFFVPMGFGDEAEHRMSQLMEYIGLVNPQTTLEERLRHAFIQENLLKHMWDQGVRYGATCLLRSDEDDVPRLTTAQFTVSIILADVSGNDPLSTLAESLRLRGKNRETAVDELPTGPALLVADESQVTLSAELLGAQEDSVRTTRQIQAFIPLPGGSRMATLALATEALDDWDNYLAIMREILGTVSFRKPGTRSSIETRLDGLM